MRQLIWRGGGIITMSLLVVVLSLLSFTITMPTPVEAQLPALTATPNDPAWLAFSLARGAVEQEKKVRLRIVSNWTFAQSDWSAPNESHPQRITGIDSCVSTVISVNARDQIFGWTIRITATNGTIYTARVSFDLKDVAVCDLDNAVAAAPTQAPAANGTPVASASLPTPVPGSAATGRFELGGHVDGLTSNAINAMRTAGMTWVKKQLPTAAGVGKGIEFINDAKSNGFKILLGVVGDKAALGANPQAYHQTYASFVAQLASAGADAIEVWNEPNIDREWPAGQVTGGNYTQLLAAAYNAIKAANPGTLVISGAPSPTGFFGGGCAEAGCDDDVFMRQMAQAGAANYMDCLGLHYNEGVVAPSANSGDPRPAYPTRYYSSMTNRGRAFFPNKPVCYTELGYLSGEGMGAPIPGGFNWTPNDPVTVAEQAAWLAEAATISAQWGYVRMMIVWNVNFTRWDSDPMGGYAIIRPDGSCPACAALGAVMRR